MLCIELLALAQIGWLGCLFALLGHLSPWGLLRKAGFVISIVSVAGYGVFWEELCCLGMALNERSSF